MRRSRIRYLGLTRPESAAAALIATAISGCAALGAGLTDDRLVRLAHSSHWDDGRFVNPQPLSPNAGGTIKAALTSNIYANPSGPVPVVTPDPRLFETPPVTGLRVTWLGHSSMLVEIEGHRILTDPVWSDRAGPVPGFGPKRWYPPPIALSDLPPIDVVVISHDHYDHLDYQTIVAMKAWRTAFVVPLGIGADLEAWGIPRDRIIELDWWQNVRIHGVEIVCTPARHVSGRILIDEATTLWAGFAFLGAQHRVYYSGDTGLFPALREIGERLGPFDLTMIEVGQYDRAWPDWHLGPEQAVRAHQMVRGRVLLPVHWGAFSLAPHGWTEPIERSLVAAQQAGVSIVAPRPGESFEPETPPPVRRWWPTLPWKTATQDPIVATQVN